MSLKITIEEAEAFDRLSILEIKQFHKDAPEEKNKVEEQIQNLINEINEYIDFDLSQRIYSSDDYTELYNINFELFTLFNDCKKRQVDASEPDSWNYKRHLAKQKIQNKYFGNNLQEIKMGYDKTS